MELLQPIWLWALTGLLVPVMIHLLSKKEGKTIYIGSIRHLIDSKTAKLSSLRLNEILLLLLRVIFLALLVLLLSQAVFSTRKSETKWLLIEQGIEQNKQYATLIDSLTADGFEKRWLADGFTFLDDSLKHNGGSYWTLIEQLKSTDTAVVLSYAHVNRFNGSRVSLPSNVLWIMVDEAPKSFVSQAIDLKDRGILVREGNTNGYETAFQNKLITDGNVSGQKLEIEIRQPDTLDINIIYEDEYNYDKNILSAALSAIAEELNIVISMHSHTDADYQLKDNNVAFWLSSKALPDNSAKVFILKPCDNANALILKTTDLPFGCTSEQEAEFTITKRLTEEVALEQNLTIQLARILTEDLPQRKKTIPDNRVMPQQQLWSKTANTGYKVKDAKENADAYIAAFALLVLVVERWISFKRNQ